MKATDNIHTKRVFSLRYKEPQCQSIGIRWIIAVTLTAGPYSVKPMNVITTNVPYESSKEMNNNLAGMICVVT
jgi:hypothetical protein